LIILPAIVGVKRRAGDECIKSDDIAALVQVDCFYG
jgi:hypothetical protein